MPSIDLIVAILVNLAPYFGGAALLALATGIFIPWSVDKPSKWLYLYILAISFVASGSGDNSEGSSFKQLSWIFCYLMCAITLYRMRKETGLQKVHWPIELWLLLAWMLLSIAWSPYAFTSFKRYMLIIGALLVATLTTRMTPISKPSTHFLLIPLVVCIFFGLAHAALLPERAFGPDGAMRGFSIQKNPWGQLCLLCAMVFLHAIVTRKNKIYYIVLMIPALGMLYLSKSATSLLAFASMAVMMLVMVSLLSRRMLGAATLATFLAVTAVATLAFTVLHGELPLNYAIESIYKVTDKSSTLTGRTHLWYLMWGEISHHLWLGTGIGGFWNGLEGASGVLARKLDWGPPGQAHSGYIDMLNEIGIIGMVLLLLLLLRHVMNCWKLYRHGHRDAFLFHSAVFTVFLTINYAESSFFLGSSIWFIIFISSVVQANSLCVTETSSQPVHTTRKAPRSKRTSVQQPTVHDGNRLGAR